MTDCFYDKLPNFARGQSFTMKVEVYGEDEDGNEVAEPIGGYRIVVTFKPDIDVADNDASAVQILYDVPDDADAANGIAFVPITAADTTALPVGKVHYDAWLEITGTSPLDTFPVIPPDTTYVLKPVNDPES